MCNFWNDVEKFSLVESVVENLNLQYQLRNDTHKFKYSTFEVEQPIE